MIHDLILNHVRDQLELAMITSLPIDDTARAGVVALGELQGDPDPDQARISVTLHENDPDAIYGANGTTSLSNSWDDEMDIVECGGVVTWKRRFTVKARCLLVNTGEDKTQTRKIAATVRQRIETALLQMSFSGVSTDSEFVSQNVVPQTMKGEMVQAGGPPDAYDYHIKVRFEVKTTTGANP